MAKFMSVRENFSRNMVRRVAEAKSVVAKPMLGDRGKATAKIMRDGTRGIKAQFAAQSEFNKNGSVPWDKTQPFGTRKAPRYTLRRSGKYRSAWLGGVGSVVKIKNNEVTIGVDKGVFPQVKIHQGPGRSTRIFPKKKITKGPHRGDWRMRFLLGLTYGVWLSNERISLGFKIPHRRLSISTEVRKEVAKMVGAEVKKKLRIGVQGPMAVA